MRRYFSYKDSIEVGIKKLLKVRSGKKVWSVKERKKLI